MSLLHEIWSASQVSALAKMRVAGKAEVVEAQRAVMSRTRKGAGSRAKIIFGVLVVGRGQLILQRVLSLLVQGLFFPQNV